jgi:uncharacterized protein
VRVVLDTNTVVSGLLWGGAPRGLIDAATAGEIEIICAEALLDELRDVLNRPKFAQRLLLRGVAAAELLDLYHQLVRIVVPGQLPAPVTRDPDDDLVLACALAAQAEVIVSGDDDLLSLSAYAGVPILTAPALLARLRPPPTP